MKIEMITAARVNLSESGHPDIDIIVIPEVDENGNKYFGCYLSHRQNSIHSFMFGLMETIEECVDIAVINAPDYIPDFLEYIQASE